jgi:site-specific DNA-methyltransferase (adenine-specific)
MAIELFNVDCMTFMREQPDKAFDLAIVDPPYFDGPNQNGFYGKGVSNLGVKRQKHYAGTAEWKVPDADYFYELLRVSKNQIIWGANHFAGAFDSSSPGWIVWDKDNGASSFADAELAYTSFAKGVRIFKYLWMGMHQGQMGGNKKLNEVRIHPTQKPIRLYEWILQNYATAGQKILDTHLGSGSSAIAAHNMGFDFVGTEIDKAYFDAAQERVKFAMAQTTIFDIEAA